MKSTAELFFIPLNASGMISEIAQVCYQSPRPVPIKKLVEAGHLSVLEHMTATFHIRCSTKILLQLTRHRHASFTVQSSRGSELDGFYATGDDLLDKLLEIAMKQYHDVMIERKDLKKEDIARLLPQGAMYELFMTMNLRGWYEYLPKRLCKRAQEEHRELAEQILKELEWAEPDIFKGLTANCKYCREEGCSFA